LWRSNHADFFQYQLIDFLRLLPKSSAASAAIVTLRQLSGIGQLYLKRDAPGAG
jgi:hypothetical protein